MDRLFSIPYDERCYSGPVHGGTVSGSSGGTLLPKFLLCTLAALLAVLLPTQAALGAGSVQLLMSTTSDADIEDNAPPADAQPQPDEASAVPYCPDSGWKFTVNSSRNRFLVKERVGYVNRATQGTDKFVFNASKKATTEYAVSAGVSATAGSTMFGEVQASVNVEVRQAMEYGLSFGGETWVPPRTQATAKLGFRRTIADGKSYFLTESGCRKTNVNLATLKAPWEKTWVVDKEAL